MRRLSQPEEMHNPTGMIDQEASSEEQLAEELPEIAPYVFTHNWTKLTGHLSMAP